MRIPSGVVDQYLAFVAVDATDFATRETGLATFTVYRSRNGGTPVAMTTPTISEASAASAPGVYWLLADEDMTIDAGDDSQEMVFHITHAGMAPVTRTIELYRPKITVGETSTAQTGDSFARLGAPAGASVSADVAAVKVDTAAILIDTAEIGAAGAGLTALATAAALATVDTEVGNIQTDVTAILADTADIQPKLGTPAGVSVSADIAAIKVDTAAIPTATENADAYLDRDMAAGVDTNARSPRNAMRFLRNKYSIAGTTLTVTKEDDIATAWTSVLTTNASADPVTGSDPS